MWGKYRSQEGLERHPEKMTVDAPAEGELLWAQASVGIQPPGLPVAVGAETRMRRWDSEVDGTFKRVRGLDRGFWLRVEF